MKRNQTDTIAVSNDLDIQAVEQQAPDQTRQPAGAETLGDVAELGLDAAASVLDGTVSSIVEGVAEVASEAVGTVIGLAADLVSGIFD